MSENISLRKLSKRGGSLAITLPPQWMRELEWTEKDTVALTKDSNGITLEKVKFIKLATGRVLEVE